MKKYIKNDYKKVHDSRKMLEEIKKIRKEIDCE